LGKAIRDFFDYIANETLAVEIAERDLSGKEVFKDGFDGETLSLVLEKQGN
jgi:hypothetical protein